MSVSSCVLDKGVALLTEHGALVDAAKIPIGHKFGSCAKLMLRAGQVCDGAVQIGLEPMPR